MLDVYACVVDRYDDDELTPDNGVQVRFMVHPGYLYKYMFFFFSSRRRHTRLTGDWSSDVCSSDLNGPIRIRSTIFGNPCQSISARTANSTKLPGISVRSYGLRKIARPFLAASRLRDRKSVV